MLKPKKINFTTFIALAVVVVVALVAVLGFFRSLTQRPADLGSPDIQQKLEDYNLKNTDANIEVDGDKIRLYLPYTSEADIRRELGELSKELEVPYEQLRDQLEIVTPNIEEFHAPGGA